MTENTKIEADLVEMVALSVSGLSREKWNITIHEARALCRRQARNIVASLKAAGLAVVPVEATDEMVISACCGGDKCLHPYDDMCGCDGIEPLVNKAIAAGNLLKENDDACVS